MYHFQRKFAYRLKEFVRVALRVHFHAIQRSDRTIDDRFRQTEVDDESKEKFAEDRFNQLKNRQRSDRLSSQGKMAKPASD